MNRKEARKCAEIMMAYADGKSIEFFDGTTWGSVNNPMFNFGDLEYRIKPEPTKRFMTRNEVLRFVTNTMGIIVRDVYSMACPANASDYAEYEDNPSYYEWAFANFDDDGEPTCGWNKFEVEE